MDFSGKVGQLISVPFALTEADGFTLIAGQAADVDLEIWLDDRDGNRTLVYAKVHGQAADPADVEVSIVETSSHDYAILFTPLLRGDYDLNVRHDASSATLEARVQIFGATIDDVVETSAYLVSIVGADAIRVGADWSPVLRFLRRATLTPFDPSTVTSLEVLAGDGDTLLELIDGTDLDRTGLGEYVAAPAPLEGAGVFFLRVTFVVNGTGFIDIIRLLALPALDEVVANTGGSTVMARVYTCPATLRRQRFNLDALEDDEIWELIRDASAHVEALTQGNIFNGEYGVFECSGRGRRVVYHPIQHPFCRVEQVELDGDRTDHERDSLWRRTLGSRGVTVVDADKYVLRAGMVEGVRFGFPAGPGNVLVTGAIGSLEPAHYAATTSTTAVGPAANSVDVASVTGFSARDVLEIVGDAGAVRTIITRVDIDLNRIFFDPQGGSFAPIESGAVVRTFGQVPRAVERVTNYLCGLQLRELLANADGDDFAHPARIQAERTDDYEIKYQWLAAGQTLTGSPTYDQLLLPYMKATVVRFP